MNLSEEQYELIEAYLTNELSVADRTSFERDIQADTELKKEVDRQRNIRLGLRALGIERAIEQAKQHYKANSVEAAPDDKPQTIVRPLMSWRNWAAAASVVLVLGLGYYTYQQTTDRQDAMAFSETFSPDPSGQLLKDFPSGRVSSVTRAQFLDAISSYEAGNYDAVINQLKTLPIDKQTIDYKNYFLGLSYLANKQPTEAISLLTKALTTPSTSIRRKAEWFLSLAYIKNGQKEKALPTLKRISLDKASPFQSTAQRVLRKIE